MDMYQDKLLRALHSELAKAQCKEAVAEAQLVAAKACREALQQRIALLEQGAAAPPAPAPAPAPAPPAPPAPPEPHEDLVAHAAAAAPPGAAPAGGAQQLELPRAEAVRVLTLADLKTMEQHGQDADRAIALDPLQGLRGEPDLRPGTLLQVRRPPFGGMVIICDYSGVQIGLVDARARVVLDPRPLPAAAAPEPPEPPPIRPVPKPKPKARTARRPAHQRRRQAPAETVVYEDSP